MKTTVELTPEEAAELIKTGFELLKKQKVLSVTVGAGQELRGYGPQEKYVPVPEVTIEIEL